MILPLTGKQYSEKVVENCVAYWKGVGTYTDDEANAVEQFLEVFKDETFPPGASILFTQSPLGSLTVSVSFQKCLILPFSSPSCSFFHVILLFLLVKISYMNTPVKETSCGLKSHAIGH